MESVHDDTDVAVLDDLAEEIPAPPNRIAASPAPPNRIAASPALSPASPAFAAELSRMDPPASLGKSLRRSASGG
eukprot:424644-Prorocentrum_minimum.AAC.1